MSSDTSDISTLSTKLEEQFVSPLTAVRLSLEILRDFHDLEQRERQKFVENALWECERLERGVEELTAAVYAAGRQARKEGQPSSRASIDPTFSSRIHFDDDLEIVDIDFGDFEFSSSRLVNSFFDTLEDLVRATRRRWYFVANHRNCRVWPEAWVAFAHRGRTIRDTYALGTVLYGEDDPSNIRDSGVCASRAEALTRIEAMKSKKQ